VDERGRLAPPADSTARSSSRPPGETPPPPCKRCSSGASAGKAVLRVS